MLQIDSMDKFQSLCKEKLLDWCLREYGKVFSYSNFYIVWSCKALQNYKCLASTSVDGDGIYAEYTFNGDKHELYEDVYKKLTNTCYKK